MQSSNSGWSVAAAREWYSLAREPDPQLYWEGVFAFASRLENDGHLDSAASAYQKILSDAPTSLALREAARRRLDAFQGRGEAGARAEFLLRRFADQASEPSTLLAMGLAGAAFQMARAVTLSRLAASPTANFLTRGFGARAMASMTGFAVEAPTFTLAGKLGNEALGRSQDWTGLALGRELASSYLVLGGLKLTGWASQSLQQRLGASAGLGGLFHQGGMLSGILLGHRLEEWTGLRRGQPGATTLIDSLAMLLQFHVSGRILPNVLGREFILREKLLQDAVRGDGPRSSRGSFPPAFGDQLLLSVANGPLKPRESFNWDASQLKVLSQGVSSGNESRRFEENGWTRFDFEGASVNEIINLLSQHLATPEAEFRTRVTLPHDFTERVMEWGYDFQERTRRDFGQQFPLISRWSDKLSSGQALETQENAALETLQSQLKARLSIYNLAQGTLRSAVDLSRDADPANRGRQEANRRVLHDLYYRSEFLAGVDYCLSGLLEGSPLDSDLLALLQTPRGNSAGSALKDGITLASPSFPGVSQVLGSAWYNAFHDQMEFAEGRRATRALADVMANLLTNAWRYRSSEKPAAEFSANSTPDGGLRISLRDDGIGILPEHLFDLGGNGYREARKEVTGSQGFGLASVIENLRSLGWGPLWVRSAPNSRTEFRFEIPARAFLRDEVEPKTVSETDVFGLGPENSMEAGQPGKFGHGEGPRFGNIHSSSLIAKVFSGGDAKSHSLCQARRLGCGESGRHRLLDQPLLVLSGTFHRRERRGLFWQGRFSRRLFGPANRPSFWGPKFVSPPRPESGILGKGF
ncbi:MAG: hypothetical protein K8R69_08150 [Deltaproteobacteria bacterium]|nr:hypothetical protein [Deltaproteobacteria bacterium]